MEKALVRYTSVVEKLHYLNYIVVAVPLSILDELPGEERYNKRLIIELDGKERWQCGILAMGEGSGCVSVQSKRLKALGKTVGDSVEVAFFEDHSTFGTEVAGELAEYWIQDPEAERRFLQLKPGMQRYVLNYVTAVKSPEKRLERTVMLMRNLLRSPEGKETFRQLLGKD